MTQKSSFRNKNRGKFRLALLDIFLTATLIMMVMNVLLMFLINPDPPPPDVNVENKAEFFISSEWKAGPPHCDIDLWVKSQDALVYYGQRDQGLMNIDRDDRGYVTNIFNEVLVPFNIEYWTLRGIVPGEYTVNVHVFGCWKPNEEGSLIAVPKKKEETQEFVIPIELSLSKLNPQAIAIDRKTVTLRGVTDEQTVWNFQVKDDGSVQLLPHETVLFAEDRIIRDMRTDGNRYGSQ